MSRSLLKGLGSEAGGFGSAIFCGHGVGVWTKVSSLSVGSRDSSGGSSYTPVYSVFLRIPSRMALTSFTVLCKNEPPEALSKKVALVVLRP